MFKLFMPLTVLLILPVFVFPQSNSLSFTTSYPAPDGIFRDMEVKKSIATGEIENSGLSKLDDLSELKQGQIFIGHSLRLEPLLSEPADSQPGQIIYINDGSKKVLKVYDGTDWQTLGGE